MTNAAGQPAVLVENVSFAFPGDENTSAVQVLCDISFSVVRGELVCVLGPSGCGKSTLLNLIAGLLPLQLGSVAIGRLASEAPLPCTMLFQDLALFYWMTALDNVAMSLLARGVPPAQRPELARRYLAEVHLEDFASYYPHELSGGMRQRVALARALATAAPILLLDEPFGSLDPATRLEIEEDLLRLKHAHELTILMITHDVEQAVRLADRVIVLSARPAKVRTVLAIESPQPRQDIASSSAFKQLEQLILHRGNP